MEDIQKDQEFLQSAQATLAAEAKEMVTVSNRLHDNIVRAMRLMWRQLFFIWAMVIILVIAYFLVLHKTSPNGPVAVPGPQPLEKSALSSGIIVSPQVPPAQQAIKSIPIPEWQEVTGLLEQVRDAQLKKDIGLFLEAYSPPSPILTRRRKASKRPGKSLIISICTSPSKAFRRPMPILLLPRSFGTSLLKI
jgi:hypothetical protein